MDLSAPPTSNGPAHTMTHSREGGTQEIGHVTGRHEVDHTGSSEAGTASDIYASDVMQHLYNSCL